MDRYSRSFFRQRNAVFLSAPIAGAGHLSALEWHRTPQVLSDLFSFENALLLISDYLTEAVGQIKSGRLQEAHRLFAEAEIFASLLGNEELIHLVQVWRRDNREDFR